MSEAIIQKIKVSTWSNAKALHALADVLSQHNLGIPDSFDEKKEGKIEWKSKNIGYLQNANVTVVDTCVEIECNLMQLLTSMKTGVQTQKYKDCANVCCGCVRVEISFDVSKSCCYKDLMTFSKWVVVDGTYETICATGDSIEMAIAILMIFTGLATGREKIENANKDNSIGKSILLAKISKKDFEEMTRVLQENLSKNGEK